VALEAPFTEKGNDDCKRKRGTAEKKKNDSII
jgi:hypothetical protein